MTRSAKPNNQHAGQPRIPTTAMTAAASASAGCVSANANAQASSTAAMPPRTRCDVSLVITNP